MEEPQYGTWFSIGACGSIAAIVLAAFVVAIEGSPTSDEMPGFAVLLYVLAAVLALVSIWALAGFMSAVLDYMREQRKRTR
jgi:uncharacterized membrane protein